MATTSLNGRASQGQRLLRYAIPCLLVLATAGLRWIYDFSEHPLLFLCVVGASFILLGLASRSSVLESLSLGQLLVVGGLLRALLVPVPLSLSDDVYRYLWDGKLVLAGHNPYALVPEADSLVGLRDEIWERTAHRDTETVYPPLALGLFSISSTFEHPIAAYKILLVVLDLGTCALLWSLARSISVPTIRVIWYAWNPLIVLEGAAMGHIDIAGLFALMAGLVLLVRAQRDQGSRQIAWTVGAAAAFCSGVLIKLVPLVLLPLWLIRVSRSRAFGGAVGAILGVSVLWVVVSTGGVPPGLVRYAISWEYNGPVFEPLWRLLDLVRADNAAHAALSGVGGALGLNAWLEPVLGYAYPQFLAKVVLGGAVLWAVLVSCSERDVVAGSGRLLMRVSLLSATLYPWYLVWSLPFAALFGSRSWLLLSGTMILAYLPRLFGVDYFPWVYLAIWAPVAVLFLLDGRRSPHGREAVA